MDQQRNLIARKPRSKAILILALLLSLLSFSGQAIYQSNKHHTVKTEQVVSINKFSRKSKITTVSPHENRVVATYSNHHRLGVLLAYTRSIKICMEHINREALTFPKPTGFFIFSDVTHTSDEDNFNSIRG